MGGSPLDVAQPQQLWGQRALATSRTQQSVCQDQWELIIENGNAHARAITDLKKELELVQQEMIMQRGSDLNGCSGLARVDRLIQQQTHRMMAELQVDMDNSWARLEKKYQAEVQRLDTQLTVMVETKLKQQKELQLLEDPESRCSGDVWAGMKKEQYSHEVYIQDMMRRFGATMKEQDARALATQEHTRRLEKELRAFMKEHDTGLVSEKEELRNFCTAMKAGLDARVTCLHERVGDVEKGMDKHVSWVQGELHRVHARPQQELQGTFNESVGRFEKELDMHVNWVHGELRRLHAALKVEQDARTGDARELEMRFEHELKNFEELMRTELRQLSTAVKAEQDARAAVSKDWNGRLEEQLESQAAWVHSELNQFGSVLEESNLRLSRQSDWVSLFEKERDQHVRWAQGELRRIGAMAKDGQGGLQRLGAALEIERQARAEGGHEHERRASRLEATLSELDCRVARLREDLQGHSHEMAVEEHYDCGPAECLDTKKHSVPVETPHVERSPERTWEAAAEVMPEPALPAPVPGPAE